MKIRPIIFSTPMVKALLDGRKTQTRRLIASPLANAEPGDLLWVREALHAQDGDAVRYETKHAQGTLAERWDFVDAEIPTDWGYHRANVPSIHMPRWASRLTLEVTDRRVQKLHWITEEDAIAEGVPRDEEPCDHIRQSCADIGCLGPTHKASFCELWAKLHGWDSWEESPEVVAITFKVHKVNVDKMR